MSETVQPTLYDFVIPHGFYNRRADEKAADALRGFIDTTISSTENSEKPKLAIEKIPDEFNIQGFLMRFYDGEFAEDDPIIVAIVQPDEYHLNLVAPVYNAIYARRGPKDSIIIQAFPDFTDTDSEFSHEGIVCKIEKQSTTNTQQQGLDQQLYEILEPLIMEAES